MHKAFRESYEIRQRNEEWARWRSGMYIFDALLCAAPMMRTPLTRTKVEPGKYPEEPWPLTDKEAREREEAREKQKVLRFLEKMNAVSERELKRQAEEKDREEVSKNG